AYPHTFPLNASIFYAVLLQLLPERLVAASDLVFLGVLVLATYGIGRILADHRSALLAASGLAVIPLVAYSSFGPGSDIGGLAFLALATYVVCRDDLPVSRRAALAGMACGLAYGFKSLHLISTAVLGAALLYAALFSSGATSARAKTAVRVFVVFS